MVWKKRGELTSRELVIIISLVVGFVIVVAAFFAIDWAGNIDSETCHQSVVYRATIRPTTYANIVPLQCKVSKICVTAKKIGKGDCEEFEGESNVATERVSTGEKGKTQVEQIVAREIVDCWSMMGKGELSLFSRFWADQAGFSTVYPTCVMCTRVAFDSASLRDAKINLRDIDVDQYMLTHKVSGTEKSYYEFISGQVSTAEINLVGIEGRVAADLDSATVAEQEREAEQDDEENLDPVPVGEGNGGGVSGVDGVPDQLMEASGFITELEEAISDSIDEDSKLGEVGVLFMQVSSPTHMTSLGWFAGATASVAVGGKTGGFLTRKIPFIGAGTRVGSFIGRALTPVRAVAAKALAAIGVTALAYQQINVARSRGITAGYCGDIEVGTEARNGCSAVRMVNYGVEDISNYCSVIESIP